MAREESTTCPGVLRGMAPRVEGERLARADLQEGPRSSPQKLAGGAARSARSGAGARSSTRDPSPPRRESTLRSRSRRTGSTAPAGAPSATRRLEGRDDADPSSPNGMRARSAGGDGRFRAAARSASRPSTTSGAPRQHAQGRRVDRGQRESRARATPPADPSSIRTATIEPAGSASMSRPRAATRGSASSSEKTPASVAATNSPRLWPSIAAGRMPQLSHSRASAYSTTKSAGWAIPVRWIGLSCAASRPSAASRSRASSRLPSSGPSSSQQRSTSSRKTGSVS